MTCRRYGAVALALATVLVSGAGCSSGSGDQELTVLAAASLTGTFTRLEQAFVADHPGVDVRLSFDSSATLAQQVVEGAPADVLATADERTMQTVVDAGGTDGPPDAFASNHLVLVVPAENPAQVRSVDDLARPGVDYVVCVPSAPCGDVAATVLDQSGIDAPAASEETDVKAVLSKVELGEADAGLVYATDAADAGDAVHSFEIPGSRATSTRYLVAALKDAGSPDLARAWVDLVRSDRGQQVLADAGFGPP
ncbi:MAG: molybdate ABC transporter substrate-binding protein [Nocardioides sp.]